MPSYNFATPNPHRPILTLFPADATEAGDPPSHQTQIPPSDHQGSSSIGTPQRQIPTRVPQPPPCAQFQ